MNQSRSSMTDWLPFMTLMSWLIHVVLTCIAHIPRGMIDPIASVASRGFMFFPSKAKQQAFGNIQRIYGLPPHSEFARMFVQQWIRHAVCCSIETIKAINDPSILEISGFASLKAITKASESKGNGVLFVTSHLGSWELCAYFAGRACEKRLHVLAKPPKKAWAKKEMTNLRRKMHVEVIWTDHRNVLKAMLLALKDGDSLGFVMDQKPERRVGNMVDFFGVKTPFVTGPSTLAAKASVPVIGIHVVRTGPFRYHIDSRILVEAGDQSGRAESELTQIFAGFIESTIRKYPEQWTWNYKRWKEPVEGSSPMQAAATP